MILTIGSVAPVALGPDSADRAARSCRRATIWAGAGTALLAVGNALSGLGHVAGESMAVAGGVTALCGLATLAAGRRRHGATIGASLGAALVSLAGVRASVWAGKVFLIFALMASYDEGAGRYDLLQPDFLLLLLVAACWLGAVGCAAGCAWESAGAAYHARRAAASPPTH